MKTFAEIKDGLVVNTSVWEFETPQGEHFVDITDIPNVGIDWSYSNGEFIEPPEPTPPLTPSSGDIPVSEV
jgi:hypothetical protein